MNIQQKQLTTAMQDLLGAIQGDRTANKLYHDAGYCECCNSHAPIDDNGNLTGKLQHGQDCVVGQAYAALRAATVPECNG